MHEIHPHNYKGLSITVDSKLPRDRPRFKTEPNSLSRHPNSSSQHPKDITGLPQIHKAHPSHSVERTSIRHPDALIYQKT